MGKLFGGVVALALAATGSLALAAPGSTQEEPPIELHHLGATLSPTEAVPGDDVTVTPDQNCSAHSGLLVWAVFPEGVFSWEDEGNEAEPLLSDATELADDGSWEVVFGAPDPAAPVDEEPFGSLSAAAAAEADDAFVLEVYGPEAFTSGASAYEWFGYCLEIPPPVFLDAEVTPTQSSPGDDITVTPVENCSFAEGSLEWAVFRAGEFNWEDGGTGEPVLVDFVELAPDGSWEVVFPAPAPGDGLGDEAAGAFSAQAEGDDGDEGDDEGPIGDQLYGPEAFQVGDVAYEWFGFCTDFVEPPLLDAEITSHPPHVDLGVPLVQQGEPMTVEPIDACPVTGPDDTLFWEIDTWPVEGDSELVDAGYLEVADDGTWKLDFPTPEDGDVEATEFYVIWLDCETPETLTAFYNALFFGVGDFPTAPPAEKPTEPVGPKPARPIVREPDQTG